MCRRGCRRLRTATHSLDPDLRVPWSTADGIRRGIPLRCRRERRLTGSPEGLTYRSMAARSETASRFMLSAEHKNARFAETQVLGSTGQQRGYRVHSAMISNNCLGIAFGLLS